MPRAAANEAKQAQSTAGANAATYGQNAANAYGTLEPQAQSLINSHGYDPATLGAITNAGMGATNAPFTGAASQINRQAAKSGNSAGVAGELDTLAQNKGIAGGKEAGDIQIQNANFQNQQRMAGLNLLNSVYGQNVGAQTANEGIQNQAIGTQAQASPGWAQTLGSVLGGVGGLISAPVGGGVVLGGGGKH